MADYDKQSRRMSYFRWRLREGKGLTEAQVRELNSYTARIHSVDEDALNELVFTEPALLMRKSASALLQLCRDAGLFDGDETPTKTEAVRVVKHFQKEGYRAAVVTA